MCLANGSLMSEEQICHIVYNVWVLFGDFFCLTEGDSEFKFCEEPVETWHN